MTSQLHPEAMRPLHLPLTQWPLGIVDIKGLRRLDQLKSQTLEASCDGVRGLPQLRDPPRLIEVGAKGRRRSAPHLPAGPQPRQPLAHPRLRERLPALIIDLIAGPRARPLAAHPGHMRGAAD